MGATIIAIFTLLSLIFGIIIFIIHSKISNKHIKFLLRPIMILIIGIPASCIAWFVYANTVSLIMIIIENILPNFTINNNNKIFICLYFIVVNILGVLCYILYKKKIKKIITISIKEYLFFLLNLNILCDIFPIYLFVYI